MINTPIGSIDKSKNQEYYLIMENPRFYLMKYPYCVNRVSWKYFQPTQSVTRRPSSISSYVDVSTVPGILTQTKSLKDSILICSFMSLLMIGSIRIT